MGLMPGQGHVRAQLHGASGSDGYGRAALAAIERAHRARRERSDTAR